MKMGETYQLRVYETGGFAGIPEKAYKEARMMMQTQGFHFRAELIAISGKKVDKIVWTPSDFIGRHALLSGIAKNEKGNALVMGQTWTLRLTGEKRWQDKQEKKLVEVYGIVEKTKEPTVYRMKTVRRRLVRLSDQLNSTVKLRGTARSMNGHWWFNYRGTDMYVENMKELSGWTVNHHFRPIEVTGRLEKAKLPRIDQITTKSNRDLKTYYILRQAKWSPIKELLTPEMSQVSHDK